MAIEGPGPLHFYKIINTVLRLPLTNFSLFWFSFFARYNPNSAVRVISSPASTYKWGQASFSHCQQGIILPNIRCTAIRKVYSRLAPHDYPRHSEILRTEVISP